MASGSGIPRIALLADAVVQTIPLLVNARSWETPGPLTVAIGMARATAGPASPFVAAGHS
jgi:hypothetical protein